METTIIESSQTAALAGKYLTFRLHEESYGIGVLKIREIIRLQNITPIPRMPAYIKGVINLRGKIIPVIDLCAKFGMDMEAVKDTDGNCIIVVQVRSTDRATLQMGIMVDAVEEVLNIATTDIEAVPDFGAQVDTEYILGMAKIKGVVKTLLDIDRVVSGDAAGFQATVTGTPS